MTTDASAGAIDYSKYIIEDDEPYESIYAGRLYSLLTSTLYESWPGPPPRGDFVAAAHVALIGTEDQIKGYCPDMMLAVNVRLGDLSLRENNAYFVWVRGKPPDVVMEMVSPQRLDESHRRPADYARIGVPYYVVFDPNDLLGRGVLRSFVLRGENYELMSENAYPEVGLGLVPWRGAYFGMRGHWLRWCDLEGRLIPTSEERIWIHEQSELKYQQSKRRTEALSRVEAETE